MIRTRHRTDGAAPPRPRPRRKRPPCPSPGIRSSAVPSIEGEPDPVNDVVTTPTAGIDPRTALAMSIHAAPGVYALLLGSGISSEAGVPTGWHVSQDLVRRISVAEGVDLLKLGLSPEAWFLDTYGHEPRYDELLKRLAPTDPARRALLRGYFDPPPGDHGPLEPTAAHHVIAGLCAVGRIRVIVTTNFDRLLERALDEAGADTQVLVTQAIAAALPRFVISRQRSSRFTATTAAGC